MNAFSTDNPQGFAVPALPAHRAEDLTDGGNLAHIELGEQVYTLRITRAGKLILTK
ncbi:hemin uptake protein HemP [Seohaeicola saemankumensis]|nr:hemin uptake protein HemP [Seohaeicola saemankumensis]MCA0871214.1 hemin uptake protein HemP [Seohaeicola saemankumensis]